MLGLNPYVIGGVLVAFLLSNGVVGYKAYQFGGDHVRVECEKRVSKLQGEYDAQAKRIAELNKQWQATLDAFVEQEAERAKARQEELDDAQVEIANYASQLEDSKRTCVLDDSDLGVIGVQHGPKRQGGTRR